MAKAATAAEAALSNFWSNSQLVFCLKLKHVRSKLVAAVIRQSCCGCCKINKRLKVGIIDVQCSVSMGDRLRLAEVPNTPQCLNDGFTSLVVMKEIVDREVVSSNPRSSC